MSLISFIVSSLECQSSELIIDGKTYMAHHLKIRVGDDPEHYGIADLREDGQPGFSDVPVFKDICHGCTLLCRPNINAPTMMGEIVAVVPIARC